jgi:exosortase H (IPTLxxWG-CTERM-specific)
VSQDRQQAGPAGPGRGGRAGTRALARRLRGFWRVPTYRFAVTFLALLVGIGLSYPWLRLRYGGALLRLQDATALLVYHLAALFSADVQLSPEAPTVIFRSFPTRIIEECTGLYQAMLLGAALLAFPTTWRKTLVGFALGIPLIYALNVVRLAMLLWIGHHFRDSFEFVHVYLWQGTTIVILASVLYVWVRWVVREDGAPPRPTETPAP